MAQIEKNALHVNTSARKYGIDIVNVGTNIEWQGTDMSALRWRHEDKPYERLCRTLAG